MISGNSWAWLKTPSPRLTSTLTISVCDISMRPSEGEFASISDLMALPSFAPTEYTSISVISSFFTSGNSGFCMTMSAAVSSSCLSFRAILDSSSWGSVAAAEECLPSPTTLPPSPSDSEPEAELLSDGERDGDFFSCFSSFFLFFFFFLAACFLCFLDFISPSVLTQSKKRHT